LDMFFLFLPSLGAGLEDVMARSASVQRGRT
jgi:hypothetical protein